MKLTIKKDGELILARLINPSEIRLRTVEALYRVYDCDAIEISA